MKSEKVRLQLQLPAEVCARLGRIAAGAGRARSAVLVEAIESWLDRRNPDPSHEILGARLTRIERHIEAVRRQQGLQWEVLARMLRHQLLTAAGLPPADPAARAIALRAFEDVIDEIAARVAGTQTTSSPDSALDKVREFH